MKTLAAFVSLLAGVALAQQPATTQSPASQPFVANLAERYPAGSGQEACNWSFGTEDIFHLSRFYFEGPDGLKLKTGPADLGIGHCAETGAVWAIVIPRRRGQLVSSAADVMETFEHAWLRFHPDRLGELFPADTVVGPGQSLRHFHMSRIANDKIRASFHVGRRASLPPRHQLVVDVDTSAGVRRFFAVDTTTEWVQYLPVFERRTLPPVRPVSADKARAVFDRVWEEFDRQYAGFGLRPEVDWNAVRETFRPRLGEVSNTIELAQVLAEMLRPLRDLHIWLRVDGQPVPVYRRPRSVNGNVMAAGGLISNLEAGNDLRWGRTPGGLGYLAVDALRNREMVAAFDEVLASLRDTRALILDLRFNGGGNERLAQQMAGRFAKTAVPYASAQVRTGPAHTDLGPRETRTLEPRGPWTFERPVYVLIGPRCMSSAEAFAGMLGELPQVRLLGVPTAGSSGNPRELEAGEGIVVSVPQWLAFRADGQALDERGIEPDLRVDIPAERFQGRQDGLLQDVLRLVDAEVKAPKQPDSP